MEYNEDSNYFIYLKNSSTVAREPKSGNLIYIHENVINNDINLLNNNIVAYQLISKASEELQKEYRKLIDKEL